MDPFLQSTVAKNRQYFPTRSVPISYPPSNTKSSCSEFHTPEGIYHLQQDWLAPHIIPQFAIGTHVTTTHNRRRRPPSLPSGSLALPAAKTLSTASSISDIIYGSSMSSSEHIGSVSPTCMSQPEKTGPPLYQRQHRHQDSNVNNSDQQRGYQNSNNSMNSGITSTTPPPDHHPVLGKLSSRNTTTTPTTTSSSTTTTTTASSTLYTPTNHTGHCPSVTSLVSRSSETPTNATTPDPMTIIPILSVETTSNEDSGNNNSNNNNNLSLNATISNTSSLSSLFSSHWRGTNLHPQQDIHRQHSGLRPKNNISKLKSSLIENVQTHPQLSKILANRHQKESFLFYNTGACFLWMDTHTKDFLTCITFSRTIPTCHDINKTTLDNDHLDIIIGFNSGDIVWYDPLCHRYTRFNKHGALHNAKVTAIKWVPGSEDLFMVAFNDGVVLIMDRVKDDQAFISPQTKLLSEYEFIVTQPHSSKQQRYNPVSYWQVSQKAVTALEFSKDGSLVALIGSDGLLRIFDFNEESLYDVFSGYFGKLLCLAWSPDNKYILTGGQDDLISIWSLTEQRIVARCQGHKSWVTGVAFDTKKCVGKQYRFASVGEDCKLILWDFSTSTLHKPKKHKQPPSSCIFSLRDSTTNGIRRLARTSGLFQHHDSISERQQYNPLPSIIVNMDTTMVHDNQYRDMDDVEQSYTLKRYVTAPATATPAFTEQQSFGRTAPPKKTTRRFLQKQQSKIGHSMNSDNSQNQHQQQQQFASYVKKLPASIHPVLDKTHVPYLQPLVAILVHDDPCVDILFDENDENDENDDDDDDGDDDVDIDDINDRNDRNDDVCIFTTDRRGCVRKWCK